MKRSIGERLRRMEVYLTPNTISPESTYDLSTLTDDDLDELEVILMRMDELESPTLAPHPLHRSRKKRLHACSR